MKFWRMTGLIASSPVDTILDKASYTLEELLDEDETIPELRSRNSRLIDYLRNRAQLEQLIHYIVDEAKEDADEKHMFKFPFIACEIFVSEVDVTLNTLAEDEELMGMLFSFLKPDHPKNTLLAGYFSKVVLCLMSRKTAIFLNYVQNHQEILRQLVDLIGITSIMEILIRLLGADENIYANYVDEMLWLKDTDVLDKISDKFCSSDSPQVHANAAEVLCAIIRYAPPGLAAEICSSSFMGKLFSHALEGSRPKSVLVHSLSVCISLLDPKRLVSASYNLFQTQLSHGALVVATPETVGGMLENLGDLLKLLDVSSAVVYFPTTYGYLKPPFGQHRLKIVQFISILLTIGSEAAEREFIQKGAIKHILDLFFEYPFNNFLHQSVENIVGLCLDSRSSVLIKHLLEDCEIVARILGAEKQPLLTTSCSKPTLATKGRSPPRIGSFGHTTRIANKLIQAANNNDLIQTHLQENKEWAVWHTDVLLKRNAIECVNQWTCGRPTILQDLVGDISQGSENEAHNAETPTRSVNDEVTETDVYLDNIPTEDMSSAHASENSDNVSLFTDSDWFAHEGERLVNSELPTQDSDSDPKGEDSGNSSLGDSPVRESADTKPSSLLDNGEELTEPTVKIHDEPDEVIGRNSSFDLTELPDSKTASSASDHQPSEIEASETNVEECSKDVRSEGGNQCADTGSLETIPTAAVTNPQTGPSEDSLNTNADPDISHTGPSEDSLNTNADPDVGRTVITDNSVNANADPDVRHTGPSEDPPNTNTDPDIRHTGPSKDPPHTKADPDISHSGPSEDSSNTYADPDVKHTGPSEDSSNTNTDPDISHSGPSKDSPNTNADPDTSHTGPSEDSPNTKAEPDVKQTRPSEDSVNTNADADARQPTAEDTDVPVPEVGSHDTKHVHSLDTNVDEDPDVRQPVAEDTDIPALEVVSRDAQHEQSSVKNEGNED